MKKLFFLVAFLATMTIGTAQNIQLHYDFGRALYDEDYATRPHITSTVEMFRPDKFGNTFFFVDMDYTNKGIASAYWEIFRELRFWKSPFSIHMEYNGGLCSAFPYNNAYLFGGSYAWNNKDFSKGFTLSALYKYIQKSEKPNSFQLTASWYMNIGKDKLFTFSGFADFWKEKTSVGNYVFISEPQIWVNLNAFEDVPKSCKLSIGSELEITNDFAGRNGLHVIPTLALKWTFN